MRIRSAQLYRYALPLVRPLNLPGHELYERNAVLLPLQSDDGMVGWGDVAPLPGFSSESVGEAERELAALVRLLGAVDVKFGEEGLWSEMDCGTCPPSVAFGLETALASLLQRTAGADPSCLSGLSTFGEVVPVNGLLVGDQDGVLREGRVLIEGGCRTLKLKLGRRSAADDIVLTRSVRDVLGKHAVIRLDANRSWDLREAIRFGQKVGAEGIAYIEEPLADPSALPEFFKATGIPVGLDESLRELAPEDLGGREDVGAVILKPTLLGGVEKARRWADQAVESNVLPVVSSSFESGIGILGLARFASSLSRPDIAVGLDTYRWLDRDVVTPRLRFENGAVHSSPGAGRRYEVDESLLHEIRDA